MDEGKRKETRKEWIERLHREAENLPTVRKLRELVARGEAELAARREGGSTAS
jgi:hypothetical protein